MDYTKMAMVAQGVFGFPSSTYSAVQYRVAGVKDFLAELLAS